MTHSPGPGPVPPLGASFEGGAIRFRIWAPEHRRAEVVLHAGDGSPASEAPMEREPGGFFSALVPAPDSLRRRALYSFRVDGRGPFPDPFSLAQPLGVHGPSEIAELDFPWTDAGWRGVPAGELSIYELHVGTATPEGTFEALILKLDALVELGVTAIELLPIAAFPGRWNWGYDGVALRAPAAPYGGPVGLCKLVDAAHARGLAVILDAVYNHVGPDGSYLRSYAEGYFARGRSTPWGDALDYDGEGSGPVRELCAGSAAMWIERYHLDGLRLDATHAMHDESEVHILCEIAERAREAGRGRSVHVIAEDGRNLRSLFTPPSEGGLGLDGTWADDFHHVIRRLFAGDSAGYYQDFEGTVGELAATLERGWLHEGRLSKLTGEVRGTPAGGLPATCFVHALQNHDQVGNRPGGDRLGRSVIPAAYRAMSALLLLSPYTPLLFMGQEWSASTPFHFFTDHHPELGRLVTEGRRRELRALSPAGSIDPPDPQAEATFRASHLDWAERARPAHAAVLRLYQELLRLRRESPALRERARGSFTARDEGGALVLDRRGGGRIVRVIINVEGERTLPAGHHRFQLLLSTEEARFGGRGRCLFTRGVARFDGPSALVLEAPL